MEATAFLILCAGILISLEAGVLVSAKGESEGNWKTKDAQENIPPPRSSFPLLLLPPFPSFSLPSLNLPYLQKLSNQVSSPARVVATKTEYMEVTRRQTVHPVCYTAYEAKAPCLPYAQSNFQDDDYENFDFDTVHQAHENFDLNEIRKSIQVTPTYQITPTTLPDVTEESDRTARYLEFKMKNGVEEQVATSSKIEGSEFFTSGIRFPVQHQVTEYQTKTVLVTKLEKYTDRRVTATLLAINCLPVDRSVPMCQSHQSPIREAPDRRLDDSFRVQPVGNETSSDGQEGATKAEEVPIKK